MELSLLTVAILSVLGVPAICPHNIASLLTVHLEVPHVAPMVQIVCLGHIIEAPDRCLVSSLSFDY